MDHLALSPFNRRQRDFFLLDPGMLNKSLPHVALLRSNPEGALKVVVRKSWAGNDKNSAWALQQSHVIHSLVEVHKR